MYELDSGTGVGAEKENVDIITLWFLWRLERGWASEELLFSFRRRLPRSESVLEHKCITQFNEAAAHHDGASDERNSSLEGWKGLSSSPKLLDGNVSGQMKTKSEKILERMITNFKSDYGNLLLSGLDWNRWN